MGARPDTGRLDLSSEAAVLPRGPSPLLSRMYDDTFERGAPDLLYYDAFLSLVPDATKETHKHWAQQTRRKP